jgi:predicted nucleic-acid-binding Zn-ribbon protein
MSLLCKIFGHRWKCYMAFSSYCKWCGIDYTEYYNSLSKAEQKKIDDEEKKE